MAYDFDSGDQRSVWEVHSVEPDTSTRSNTMSPTILLRITDGIVHMHRSFTDFDQAQRSAEAFAGAGFSVAMISATGRFLMNFEAASKRNAG